MSSSPLGYDSLTMLRLAGFITSLHLLSGLACLAIAPPAVEAKTKTQSLRSILNHFTETRHVYVDPVAKQRARDFIVKTFKDHGLHTWTEEFPSNQEEVKGGYFCSPTANKKENRSKSLNKGLISNSFNCIKLDVALAKCQRATIQNKY